jgi:hypothetical protein
VETKIGNRLTGNSSGTVGDVEVQFKAFADATGLGIE